MGYISKWESLSEAADHIMSWTDVALEEARADLCKAMSDGSLEIRATGQARNQATDICIHG
jgi:hypothetical protein